MRIFLTGATGHIGSHVAAELKSHGHSVLGLARNDEAVAKLTAAGVDVHRGSLDDAASLRSGAKLADAVIHCGFVTDFENYKRSCEIDVEVVETFGEVLKGTNKPLVVTLGSMMVASTGVPAKEDAPCDASSPGAMRIPTDAAAMRLATESNVNAIIIRVSLVHGPHDSHGFLPMLISKAREHGEAAYVDDGHHRWPAVHVADLARLYRLAVEKAASDPSLLKGKRLHASAEYAVPLRSIAEVIAKRTKTKLVSKSSTKRVAEGDGSPSSSPASSSSNGNSADASSSSSEASAYFAFLTSFAARDNPMSSEWTRATLDWAPSECGVIDDLESDTYFHTNSA